MIIIKRVANLFLIILLLISFSGCQELHSAEDLIYEFSSAYGVTGRIYSARAGEGEPGFLDAELYYKLYDSEMDLETDFALMLSEGLNDTWEVGIFVARDASSALCAYETVLLRIDFLRSMGYADTPLVLMRANTVFYSTLSDTERAERIFKRMGLYSHLS